MQLIRNKPYLTGLLVLLITIKFVLLPVIQWQNDTLWSIKQNHKRVSRANNAAANLNENQHNVQELQTRLKQLRDVFYQPQEEAAFKLEQQQYVESLIAKNNFKVTNIGWTYSAKVLEQPLTKHQLSINVSGDTSELPSLYLDLENSSQWIDIVSFSFNLIGQRDKGLGRYKGSLDLAFYQLSEGEVSSAYGQSNE